MKVAIRGLSNGKQNSFNSVVKVIVPTPNILITSQKNRLTLCTRQTDHVYIHTYPGRVVFRSGKPCLDQTKYSVHVYTSKYLEQFSLL